MVWSAVNVQSPHAEIKMGLEWGSLVNFGSRGTGNAVAPPPPPESEARISGPKSSHESGTVCLAPHCEVQGTRSQIWAGNWAQNPVPKIRPSSGPAGWDKVCAPGVIRLLCQAKARVTVSCLNWRLCQARQCDLHCWVTFLLRFSGWWFPFAAISAPFCGT